MTTRHDPDAAAGETPQPPRLSTPGGRSGRRALFALIALACALVSVLYVHNVLDRQRARRISRAGSRAVEARTGDSLATVPGSLVLFSSLVPGDGLRYRVALASIAEPTGPRALSGLVCEQVYFAGAHGVCLGEGGGRTALDYGVTDTHAYVFGSDFQIRYDIPLGGVPSRVRVSRDGRVGAATVFVIGHSYADAAFSTATTLMDLTTGRTIGNLETFAVWRDGRPFQSVDFNFWGVTFAPDGDRFYASLRSGGHTYLVEGSIAARRMQTLRENVECPSLSPDGTRLAFKTRIRSTVTSDWRFHVLDLASMRDTVLAEPRSMDDQIEWLDDRHVLYGDGNTIWMSNADGTGSPRRVLSQAMSMSVLRDAAVGRTLAGSATTALTLPVADLAVAIRASGPEGSVGATVPYTVTVANNGPADATALKIDQILTAGLTLAGPLRITTAGESYGCSQYDEGHTSCDTAKLARGDVWTISFDVRVNAPGPQRVQVFVSGAESDPDGTNDSAEVSTRVGNVPPTAPRR